MKVIRNDISMIRGDSERIKVTCYDSNQVKLPLVDGDKIYFTIKATIYATEKLLQKVITEFTEDGDALILLNPEDTKNVNFGDFMYDIQLTKANGEVTTLVPPSKFSIQGEITYE